MSSNIVSQAISQQSGAGLKILTGFQIVFENFDNSETAQLRSLAVSLGASVPRDFNKKISCAVVKWLIDCAANKRWLAMHDYHIPPFYGLSITCTGLGVVERSELKSRIQRHKGVFMQDLVKNATTHLVYLTPSGIKYDTALKWGTVHVVHMDWIHACIREGKWIPEEHYRFATNHEESMLSDDTLSATDGAALRVGSSADGSANITLSTANGNSAGNGTPASSSFGEHLACPAPEQGLVDNSYSNRSSNAVSSEKDQSPLPPTSKSDSIQLLEKLEGHMLEALNQLPHPAGLSSEPTLAGVVFYLDPHFARPVINYLVHLLLSRGAQVSVLLHAGVQLVVLCQSQPPSREQMESRLSLLHQTAQLRLETAGRLRCVSMLWLLHHLLPASSWRHLLPPPFDGYSEGESIGDDPLASLLT